MTVQTWVIGSIRKNGANEVRVSVDQYKGKTYVDVRTYYLNDRDEMAPTKKGVAIHSVEDVDKLIGFLSGRPRQNGGGDDMRRTICTECGWNNGVRIRKNRFGFRESSRECLCFGCLPTWQPIKNCKALKPKEPHHD